MRDIATPGHGVMVPAAAFRRPGLRERRSSLPLARDASRPLRIGLLNNMPDAAFLATERQFRRLIESEAELHLFTIGDMPRGAEAHSHIERFYSPHTALAAAGLDGLVVTGCEPRAPRLEAEPYYGAFAAVVDWAAEHTVSTVFSCLAAHAAVLHLDGIERRPLPLKSWGVFPCSAAAVHPLLAGLPASTAVPHSRWNDLAESDLAAQGYTVLRRSERAGVDLFVRDGRSLLVFLQGHPEYDEDSLAREHRREMGRFLDGTRPTCPPLPENYYTAEAEERLDAFAALADTQRDPALQAAFPDLAAVPPLPAAWRDPAARLFRNWLALVARRRAGLRPPSRRLRIS